MQPAALEEYTRSKGRTADALLTDFGLPADLFAQFREAGLPPSAIQAITLGVNIDDLKLVLVLGLRERPTDEARFRDKLKAQGRDPVSVELGGVPFVMAEPNEKTLVFALNAKHLAPTPSAGYDDLRPAVRESIDKLSPSALGWVATDVKDWAKLPQLKLLGDRVPPEWVKRLDGVKAAAVGLSLEPELCLGVSVRMNDSTVARETADAMRGRLGEVNGTVVPNGEWADGNVLLEPPAEKLPKLKAALKQ
jgi:hypothetical protein